MDLDFNNIFDTVSTSSWNIASLKEARPLKTSIHHWQLRHLIKSAQGLNDKISEDEESILYVSGDRIMKCCMKDGEKIVEKIVLRTDFLPLCFSYAHNFIAVGSNSGILSIFQINALQETTQIWKDSVSSSAVNSIEILKLNGEIQLLVSTNDREVRIYSLPLMNIIQICKFDVAINNASISPDGSKLLAVGDTPEVFLLNARDNYSKIASFRDSKDFVFSCSWHQNGSVFAAGSQDGLANIWDVRKYSSSDNSKSLIAQFRSKQRSSTKGAIRSVQFSPSLSIDVLVFAEHANNINIVDSRTFNERQVIKASPILGRDRFARNRDIAGFAFTPSNCSIIVGTIFTLEKYSIDTASRRSFPCYQFDGEGLEL